MPDQAFQAKVTEIVRLIPRGRVVTYGQVAALVGLPRAARAVGWTARWGDLKVPWQRVVNRFGRLAAGYPGGRAGHAAALQEEGIEITGDWTVDLDRYQWFPDDKTLQKLQLDPEALEWLGRRLPYRP